MHIVPLCLVLAVTVIRQVDRLIGSHGRAVSALECALSPRAEEVAVAIEDDDRVLSARKGIDLIFLVQGHRRHFPKRPAVRKLAPAFDNFIAIIPTAYRDAHDNLLALSLFRVSSLGFRVSAFEFNSKPETRNPKLVLFRFVLIDLPPGFKAAAHAGDILEAIPHEIPRSTHTAAAVITIDDVALDLMRVLN